METHFSEFLEWNVNNLVWLRVLRWDEPAETMLVDFGAYFDFPLDGADDYPNYPENMDEVLGPEEGRRAPPLRSAELQVPRLQDEGGALPLQPHRSAQGRTPRGPPLPARRLGALGQEPVRVLGESRQESGTVLPRPRQEDDAPQNARGRSKLSRYSKDILGHLVK